MALERFSASSIATIDDGRIGVAIEQAIDRAQKDCADRPGVDKPRKVLIEIAMTPIMGESDLDSIDMHFGIRESTPGRESKHINMHAARDGLFYNELSPEDADQLTIEPEPKLNAPPAKREKKGAKSDAG